MKLQWCWRCQLDVPMLDKEEYAKAQQLYRAGFQKRKQGTSLKKRFQPLLDYYETLTDWKETSPNVIMHHALDLYGSPCKNCGKPYRTDQAAFCPACGHKRTL
ncbi:MAG: hypothetical protein ACRBFS_18305 [Aureispira sp.]